MMHLRTVKVPAKEKKVVEKGTCDLCGIVIEHRAFSAEEVEVRHRTGSSYPEGGSGTVVEVDMCGSCFDNKLVPWLRSQGVEPQTREWDF